MIRFSCPTCAKLFSVADGAAGRKGRCKQCGQEVIVPSLNEIKPAGRVVESDLLPPLRPPVAAPAEPRACPPLTTSVPAAAQVPEVVESTPSATNVAPPTRAKLPVRIRRLLADAEHLSKAFQGSPLIHLRSTTGNPPDLYQIEYFVRGLARGHGGAPVVRDHHVVEIQLTSEYPRQSPKCKMLTPIFHPNIEPAVICVGDHWTAGERLVDLVVRIGEMIGYQSYNIKSPLDGEAAMWADLNSQQLPIDSRDLNPTIRS